MKSGAQCRFSANTHEGKRAFRGLQSAATVFGSFDLGDYFPQGT
jgi:hypothetical protein